MERKSSAGLHGISYFLVTLSLILLGAGAVSLHAAMPGSEESKSLSQAGGNNYLRQIDYSLWAPARIKAYKNSLAQPSAQPLAVLRIPKAKVVAPVLDGTDDVTLNSGVGRIPGTARPGQAGNVGIAGHRDSFFRALKNVSKGDRIELVTSSSTDVYIVNKVYITKPSDVGVLRSGPTPAVTLVTCYPFYYSGNAPQRYIVQALKQRVSTAANHQENSSGN